MEVETVDSVKKSEEGTRSEEIAFTRSVEARKLLVCVGAGRRSVPGDGE